MTPAAGDGQKSGCPGGEPRQPRFRRKNVVHRQDQETHPCTTPGDRSSTDPPSIRVGGSSTLAPPSKNGPPKQECPPCDARAEVPLQPALSPLKRQRAYHHCPTSGESRSLSFLSGAPAAPHKHMSIKRPHSGQAFFLACCRFYPSSGQLYQIGKDFSQPP